MPDLDKLAREHFKVVGQIRELQTKDKTMKEEALMEIMRMKAWPLVTINWNLIIPPRMRGEMEDEGRATKSR